MINGYDPLTVGLLTYMSIRDAIQARCEDGNVILLQPSTPNDPMARIMFLSSEVNGLLVGPWTNQAWKERCFKLRQTLEEFVEGGVIAVAANPRRAKKAYMSPLGVPSDRVWDIRARDPSPGIRIIGSFAEKDTFIALTWGLRKELKEYNSREWKEIISIFHMMWGSLFGSYLPLSDDQTLSEDNLRDYISDPVFLVDRLQ